LTPVTKLLFEAENQTNFAKEIFLKKICFFFQIMWGYISNLTRWIELIYALEMKEFPEIFIGGLAFNVTCSKRALNIF